MTRTLFLSKIPGAPKGLLNAKRAMKPIELRFVDAPGAHREHRKNPAGRGADRERRRRKPPGPVARERNYFPRHELKSLFSLGIYPRSAHAGGLQLRMCFSRASATVACFRNQSVRARSAKSQNRRRLSPT
jgi:hypothetical protein